ncbi:hypothetical protein AT291_06350 [Porphyromonas gingivalis]|nr:hypothetical protein AT291_06350 [Porphyromonas gingivalis]PDP63824.1 hypothetical protein CLI80_07910 [Porphyromonas gingivalis]
MRRENRRSCGSEIAVAGFCRFGLSFFISTRDEGDGRLVMVPFLFVSEQPICADGDVPCKYMYLSGLCGGSRYVGIGGIPNNRDEGRRYEGAFSLYVVIVYFFQLSLCTKVGTPLHKAEYRVGFAYWLNGS